MYYTKDKSDAIKKLEEYGGFLLDMGGEGDDKTYCVCDEQYAISLGRTVEELAALAPTFSEI